MLSLETLRLTRWMIRLFIYFEGKAIESRGQSDQFSSVPIKRHNAYTKRSCTTVVGEGSGLAIRTCMQTPWGYNTHISRCQSIARSLLSCWLAIVSSNPVSETEAIRMCGSQVTTPLSDTSIPTVPQTILNFLRRGQKSLDMAVVNSQSIVDILAGEDDRLYGPAAEQLRRQLMFKERRCPTDARQARRDIWWIFRAGLQVGSRKKRRRREAREL